MLDALRKRGFRGLLIVVIGLLFLVGCGEDVTTGQGDNLVLDASSDASADVALEDTRDVPDTTGGLCESVECADGEVCYKGVCYATCEESGECSSDEVCDDRRCTGPAHCDEIECLDNESCYRGVCYPTCADDTDCVEEGSVCYENRCLPPSCSDGQLGEHETDVDCGGPDCAPCLAAMACRAAADCVSGVCDGGVCAGNDCTDGETRDCYTGPSDTEDVGACTAGTQTCTGGSWEACSGDVTPAGETCDGEDDNCDGIIDEGCPCEFSGSSGGVCATATIDGTGSCEQPTGYESSESSCDTVDNDCDGQIDEGCSCTDGNTQSCGSDVGQCQAGTQTCSSGAWGTCSGEVGPNSETCDGLDNDCDGTVDNGVLTTYFDDQDGDGYGDPNASQQACSPPSGHVTNSDDCDDTNPGINPDASESCNGQDDNCDGQVDEGNPGAGVGCSTGQPGVCSAGTTQCTNGSVQCQQDVQPSSETCDGLDNNCDGATDEGVKTTYYHDADGDTYGDPSDSQQACSTPTDHVEDNTDCDDGDGGVHPNAGESTTAQCSDGADNDCDTSVDCADASCDGVGCGDGATCSNNMCMCAGSSPVRLTNSSGDSNAPDVAFDTASSAWRVSYLEVASGNDLYMTGVDSGSNAIPPTRLTTSTEVAEPPTTDFNPDTGEVGMVYSDLRFGSNDNFFLPTSNGSPGSEVRMTSLSGMEGFGGLRWSSAAGAYGVVWSDGRHGGSLDNDPYFRKISSSGASLTGDVRVSTQSGFANSPEIAASSSEYYVVWDEDPGSGRQIWMARMSFAGSKIGGDIQVSNTSASAAIADIVVGPSEVAVVYYDTQHGSGEIYLARFTLTGSLIQRLRVTNTAGETSYPKIAYQDSGLGGTNSYGIVYRDDTTGNTQILFSEVSTAGTVLVDGVVISCSPAGVGLPGIDFDASAGTFGIAWTDQRHSNNDVYFSEVDPLPLR